jgi:hypothetical protein
MQAEIRTQARQDGASGAEIDVLGNVAAEKARAGTEK